MSFQTQVNTQPAPAVEGDFASANPHASVLAGPGSLQAGAAGVIVGRFAWADNATGLVTNGNPGVAARIGFVGRTQSGAMITGFLAQASLTVLAGYEITMYNAGDFWGRFAAGAAIGNKVYANFYDGSLRAAAAGTPATEVVTATLTAANSHLGVTVAGASPIGPGMTVAGTGITAGTKIVSQISGAPGGIGVYLLSAAPVDEAAEAVTVTLDYETIWNVESTAAAGELALISSRA